MKPEGDTEEVGEREKTTIKISGLGDSDASDSSDEDEPLRR